LQHDHSIGVAHVAARQFARRDYIGAK
jgi:hypothetical protein